MRGAITGALILALAVGAAVFMMAGPSLAMPDEAQTVLQADRSLGECLAKSDAEGVGALLDKNFEWTDSNGKTRARNEVLQNLSQLATDTKSGAEVTMHFYGQVAVILGINENPRFSHIWVKQPEGWRAFIYFDTPTPGSAAAVVQAPVTAFNPGGLPVGNSANCDNPCGTIPYNPTTTADREVLAAWQKQKMAEWFPDTQSKVDAWVEHASDDLVIFIPSTATRYKADRLAELVKQKEAKVRVTPGGPIDSMRMYDFGDTVIYTANQHQTNGTKYYAVRVWIHRDGDWKIALSQQTNIKAAAPVQAAK